jgi:glycopeptide antibiotics resistance protein
MIRPPLSVALGARIAYLLLILGATLTRLRLDGDLGSAMQRLTLALNPVVGPRDAIDALRNFALFAGWGIVWVITAPGRTVWRSVALATVTGAAISVFVESVQLFSRVRHASVLDVITNSSGALAGALLVVVLVVLLTALRGKRSFVGVPALVFAGGYGLAVLLEALMPLFRQERVPNAWGAPFSRLSVAIDYLRANPLTDLPSLDLALFLPAGAFAVAALVELGMRYRTAAAITGLVAPFLFAMVQLVRGSMGFPIQSGAALTHSVAIIGGAVIAANAIPPLSNRLRGRQRPFALLFLYTLLLALWSWRPYIPLFDPEVIAVQLQWARFIPLRSLAHRVDLFSVVVVGVQFLLFVPVGALLAVWPLRQRGPLAHILPVVYLAALLELGQILMAGRFFDITDVILQISGAAIAWLVVRRTGYRPYGELLPRPGAKDMA